MAKYSKTYLLRVIKVQELYQLHKQDDLPDTKIFRRYIYPVYPMTIRTFQNYMELPAKRELKELELRQTQAIGM